MHGSTDRVCGSRGRSRTAVLAMAVAALASACDLVPSYTRPTVPAADKWSSGTNAQTVAWPSSEWWRGFRSPQLDEFEAEAERANYDLAAAIARVREADAELRIAGAALLPTVGAGASMAREEAGPQPSPGGIIKSPPATASSLSLNASYEIDFWGKNHAAAASAEASARASRYDRDTVALTIVSGVANTYFAILADRDRIAVARANISDAAAVLKALQTEEQVGTATALDVAQQATTLATLEAQLPPLREDLRQNIDALAILIGKPPQELDVTSGRLTALTQPAVAPGLPSQLLARRPDVAEAEAQLIAANANIGVARAAFFPSVQLTGQGGVANASLPSLFGITGPFYSVGAGVTQSVFDPGTLQGQLEFSRARYDELLSDYRKAVISAFGDVEDSLAATEQSSQQVARQVAAVRKARTAYDISIAQLNAGVINLLTVLNTENALFTAQDSLVVARLARLQAVVGLFKALGGGWQQA